MKAKNKKTTPRKMIFFPLPEPYYHKLVEESARDARSVNDYVTVILDENPLLMEVSWKTNLPPLPLWVLSEPDIDVCVRLHPDILKKVNAAAARCGRSRRMFLKLFMVGLLDQAPEDQRVAPVKRAASSR